MSAQEVKFRELLREMYLLNTIQQISWGDPNILYVTGDWREPIKLIKLDSVSRYRQHLREAAKRVKKLPSFKKGLKKLDKIYSRRASYVKDAA